MLRSAYSSFGWVDFTSSTSLTELKAKFLVVYTHRRFLNALSHEPGPFLAKFTDWYGAYHSALGQLHIRTLEDHKRYGKLRILSNAEIEVF